MHFIPSSGWSALRAIGLWIKERPGRQTAKMFTAPRERGGIGINRRYFHQPWLRVLDQRAHFKARIALLPGEANVFGTRQPLPRGSPLPAALNLPSISRPFLTASGDDYNSAKLRP